MDTPKPLGYWLKHLHNLLEEHLALVLSDLGTDRREWQLLNTLARGPHTRAELERALAPFWTDEARLPEVLRGLATRGWIAESTTSALAAPAAPASAAPATAAPAATAPAVSTASAATTVSAATVSAATASAGTAATVALAPAGVVAHAELSPLVERGRAVVLAGLTPQQYREVVATLAVMAGNVETAIAARD